MKQSIVAACCAAVASMFCVPSRLVAADVAPFVAEQAGPNDVRIADSAGIATIFVDAAEPAVGRRAATLLADDIARVTGRRPAVTNDVGALRGTAVIVGTLGQDKLIDRLVAEGKLDAKHLAGQWETFVIQTVEAPLPGVDRALVIAGSDRRGTAFGVFEVSEQIGVSPWYWWADVPAKQRETLAIKAGTYKVAPPTVKYRGIFINDEDWGLQPWAAKTFDPEFKQLGPKTYEKVFELLLRLKANHLWPGMHHCTVEFGSVDRNVTLADEWGIVMGGSHCEPLNRNNVWWSKDGKGEWRYDTNRPSVLKYWEEWATKRGPYEAVWTVGMRGIHDTGMPGPQDMPSQVKLLEQAIADQRDLLKKYVDKDVERVPQVFTPYKEALAHYQNGLKVPDDVTILWCEDNYGYLRQLSTPEEQKRAGGSGVYYHISYLGWPRPYLWLNTTPPALIYSEMSKALDYGADRIWMVNVGDIKPGELGAEFWMRLAWDAKRYGPDAQSQFLRQWAARDFGPDVADEIAGVMNDYYQLGFQRKPELMDDDAFNVVNYGEGERRLAAYRAMRERAESIGAKLPADKRDAYYQLVLYPVRIASLINDVFVRADLSRLYARQGRIVANEHADRSDAALAEIKKETDYFNNDLAGGKWRGMMTLKGITGNWNVQWPEPARVKADGSPRLGVIVEGQAIPISGDAEQDVGIDLDATAGRGDAAWKRLKTEDGRGYVVVPNETVGNVLDPQKTKTLSYDVEVPADGAYRLFMEINCPNDKDDSFFVRVDDGPWQTWNNMGTRSTWDWRQQGEYPLKAGQHRLTIGLREDGAMLSRIRLTQRTTALRLDEEYPNSAPRSLLPSFDRRLPNLRRYVDLFVAGGNGQVEFEATASVPWIKLSADRGKVDGQQRLWTEIDWSAAPAEPATLEGSIAIRGGGVEKRIDVRAANRGASGETPTFVEVDRYVAMEAEHFTRSSGTDAVAWRTIGKLGRSGDAVTAVPADAPSRKDAADAQREPVVLEYDFDATTTGPVKVVAYCLPTQRTHEGRGLRYAVAIGDETPQIVDFHESGGVAGEHGNAWRTNVTRNITTPTTTHRIDRPGRHTLKVWMVDPGVVIDRLVVDFGGARPSELGPPETRSTNAN